MRNILLTIDDSKQTEEAVLFLLKHTYNPSLHQLHLLHVIIIPRSSSQHYTNILPPPPDTIPTPPKTYHQEDNGNDNNNNNTNPVMTAAQSIVQHRAVDIIHHHHITLTKSSSSSSSSLSPPTPTSSPPPPPPPLFHHPITHIIIRNTHGLHGGAAAGDLVGDVIVNKAEELNALMVVMAKHNKSMLQQVFTRSCTTYCIQHCRRPILVYTSS